MHTFRESPEQQIFQQIAGSFDEPAFLRRARKTQAAWDSLLQHAEVSRESMLAVVRVKLALLTSIMFSRETDLRDIVSAADLELLQNCHDEWTKLLRGRSRRARRPIQVSTALVRFVEIGERFNRQWNSHVRGLNFDHVNALRDGYNKYYVIEKECALQSHRTAVRGFRPLPDVGPDDVLKHLPLLELPLIRQQRSI